MVPRIGGQGHGNAEPGACRELLQPVLPLGQHAGVVGGPDYIEVAQLLLLDHVLGTVDPKCRVRFGKITGPDDDHGLEQHAGLFGQAHTAEEILNPPLDVQDRIPFDVTTARAKPHT